MSVKERYYELDHQWCVFHLPERPSGYAVLLLGDFQHFVENGTTFWLQHEGRMKVLETLREDGYTIFSSHLYGAHWGSERAVQLAKQLYHLIMKKEILNQKIHIIAEGIGALIALQLATEMKDNIRSIVYIDPITDVEKQLQKEKDNPFFYKRMLKEVRTQWSSKEVEDVNAHIQQIRQREEMVAVPELLIVNEMVDYDTDIFRMNYNMRVMEYKQHEKYLSLAKIPYFLKQYEWLYDNQK